MKTYKITNEQMGAILQTVYQTNISAAQFDALKKFLTELPALEPLEGVTPEAKPTA